MPVCSTESGDFKRVVISPAPTDHFIRIDDFIWKLQLTSSNELMLAFHLPRKWSETRNSGLWQEWDDDTSNDYFLEIPPPNTKFHSSSTDKPLKPIFLLNGGCWVSEIPTYTAPLMSTVNGKTSSYSEEIRRKPLPVFRVIQEVMNVLPGFIKQHRLTHFYFTAENPEKGHRPHTPNARRADGRHRGEDENAVVGTLVYDAKGADYILSAAAKTGRRRGARIIFDWRGGFCLPFFMKIRCLLPV